MLSLAMLRRTVFTELLLPISLRLTIGLHPASPASPAGRKGSMAIGLQLKGSIREAVSALKAKAGPFIGFEDPDGKQLYLAELNWSHVKRASASIRKPNQSNGCKLLIQRVNGTGPSGFGNDFRSSQNMLSRLDDQPSTNRGGKRCDQDAKSIFGRDCSEVAHLKVNVVIDVRPSTNGGMERGRQENSARK